MSVDWYVGLPCSGKTYLADQKKYDFRLDGDDIRTGLCKDLGFSREDRFENIRRVAEVADYLHKKGYSVGVSLVTPYKELQEMVQDYGFKLIYVKCSAETCKKRDTKGMYKAALEGKIKMFTGVSDVFDEPENPDVVLYNEHIKNT